MAKKTNDSKLPLPESPESQMLRVDPEIMRMLRLIATHSGWTIKDVAETVMRDQVQKWYLRIIEELSREAAQLQKPQSPKPPAK